MTVGVFLHIDTRVILIADVNATDRCLILAEMKGCKVSKWFVGNWGIRISHIFQHVYQWRLNRQRNV